MSFPCDKMAKNLPANVRDTDLIPESGRSSEKKMLTHSSVLAWEIPWTEEPGKTTAHGVAKESDLTLATKQ